MVTTMSRRRFAEIPALSFLLSLGPCGLFAQEESTEARGEPIEEIRVIGRREFFEVQFNASRTNASADSASLIDRVPGGDATSNGPLSGQIQYRGMFGPRINVRIDGMLILGGGTNWMAPPLHHIPAALMEELVVEKGIASITTGGGIGGAATARWKRLPFRDGDGWGLKGDAEFSAKSAAQGTSTSFIWGGVSANHRLYLVGNMDEGDDYESPNGDVAASSYERDVYGVSYGFRTRDQNHEFNIDANRIETDDSGTPSLPMDIDWFDTETFNFRYAGLLRDMSLEVGIYRSSINHGMSNYLLRPAPDFSSLMLPPFLGDDKRYAVAASDESGFRVAANLDLGPGQLLVGVEDKKAVHEASVGDPDFAPFFVRNFNDTDTRHSAAFAQWSGNLSDDWYLEVGAHYEQVKMNTGEVDAFPARMVDTNPAMWGPGTPPRAVWLLREQFNSRDREQTDNNVDFVVKLRHRLSSTVVIEAAAGRKNRSPIYQERYLWIPLEINAGLGDGNNYLGNPDLQPETSNQIELGLDWRRGEVWFSPRLFLREVDDYIQGVPATNMAAIGVSRNANGDPTPLIFANTEARFQGMDLSFGFPLQANLRVEGIASQVTAKRRDISDYLYRISPDNARISLVYERGSFTASIDQIIVLDQDKISRANTDDPLNPNNNSDASDGYELTNLYLNWTASNGVAFTLGIENLFDKTYIDHLSGFNRVLGSVVPIGSRMYGEGMNVFGRVRLQW